MINANEARKVVNESVGTAWKEKVNNLIMAAAEDGEGYIVLDESLLISQEAYLTSLGYQIRTGPPNFSTEILWLW